MSNQIILGVELLDESTSGANPLKFDGEERQLKLPSPLWQDVPGGRGRSSYKIPAKPTEAGFLEIRVSDPTETDLDSYEGKRCCATLTRNGIVQRCRHWDVTVQHFPHERMISLRGPFWGFVPHDASQASCPSQ
jgi:hypothetical protein